MLSLQLNIYFSKFKIVLSKSSVGILLLAIRVGQYLQYNCILYLDTAFLVFYLPFFILNKVAISIIINIFFLKKTVNNFIKMYLVSQYSKAKYRVFSITILQ